MIFGSGIGGLRRDSKSSTTRLLHKGPDKVSAFTIPKLMVNAASGQLSIQFGLRGPNAAVVTACASATNAIGDAFKSIQHDDADVMITRRQRSRHHAAWESAASRPCGPFPSATMPRGRQPPVRPPIATASC